MYDIIYNNIFTIIFSLNFLNSSFVLSSSCPEYCETFKTVSIYPTIRHIQYYTVHTHAHTHIIYNTPCHYRRTLRHISSQALYVRSQQIEGWDFFMRVTLAANDAQEEEGSCSVFFFFYLLLLFFSFQEIWSK